MDAYNSYQSAIKTLPKSLKLKDAVRPDVYEQYERNKDQIKHLSDLNKAIEADAILHNPNYRPKKCMTRQLAVMYNLPNVPPLDVQGIPRPVNRSYRPLPKPPVRRPPPPNRPPPPTPRRRPTRPTRPPPLPPRQQATRGNYNALPATATVRQFSIEEPQIYRRAPNIKQIKINPVMLPKPTTINATREPGINFDASRGLYRVRGPGREQEFIGRFASLEDAKKARDKAWYNK